MFFFFFKQKTAYEMRISDWSSDVCSSDLLQGDAGDRAHDLAAPRFLRTRLWRASLGDVAGERLCPPVGRKRHRRLERAAPARRDAMTESCPDTRDALIDAARHAASRPYAPYSGFHVGAALPLKHGHVVNRAPVEQASHGLTPPAQTPPLPT